MVSKRNLLFHGAIFRFHVKLWEGNGSLKQSLYIYKQIVLVGSLILGQSHLCWVPPTSHQVASATTCGGCVSMIIAVESQQDGMYLWHVDSSICILRYEKQTKLWPIIWSLLYILYIFISRWYVCSQNHISHLLTRIAVVLLYIWKKKHHRLPFPTSIFNMVPCGLESRHCWRPQVKLTR